MSLYLLLSDVHASERPPSSCTDSYGEDILDLLNQAVDIALARGAVAVIIAGDLFHHKAPSRTSHRLVQRLQDILIGQDPYPFSVGVVAGNHDVMNDRLDSVHVSQPLGVLARAGLNLFQGWCSPLKVFAVPWLGYCGDGDSERMEQQRELVREVLRPYREHQQQFPDFNYLVVTHAPLYPPGRELKYEYFPARDWADAMGMKGCVFYGHVHEPHGQYGFYDAEGGVTFCNNGALSRGSLHEYNLTRQVGVTLWDSETGKFEFVPLAAKPADQVFRLKEKEQATDMQGRLDDFLAGVSGTTLDVLSTESVLVYVRTLGLGKSAEDLVEELLAEAQHGRGR